VKSRRGSVLLATLVLVFVIAAVAIAAGHQARVALAAGANAAAEREARLVARAAEQHVIGLLARGTAADALDPDWSEAVPVGEGFFWLVRPDYDDPTLPLFGLIDEASKLDLNDASFEQLSRLPGMDEALAAAVVDWRDADSEPTEPAGAEDQTYASRSPGYGARDAPFDHVEELLWVDGFTPDLLFGVPESTDLIRRLGLFHFVTVWSDRPDAADGQPRLDINSRDDRERIEDLLEDLFPGDRGEELEDRLDDFRGRLLSPLQLALVLDLEEAETAALYDRLTWTRGGRAQVDASQAPSQVLSALVGADQAAVDFLQSTRSNRSREELRSPAWARDVQRSSGELVQLGNDATPLFVGGSLVVGQQLIGRGRYHSADILAVSGDGRAFVRVRVVLDTGPTIPTIVYRRDVTHLGWPIDLDIRTALRRGDPI
jgi:DNA uptake protein ComE-like DNA-binding protein